ncbi:MAG: lipopolysaccharide biosynthesis protein RfbH [Spirochaetes bacterium GWD1_27_9]|nr:MAG: lipopolysaccharide biosynthesis protein RfbH [Spirochaetes bacterium GWB1_27_13]OHD26567.1 MAG: lipopolysaccharide biosynthesis protein RfbH [Spirochaetes bacterium GWC1_27_15]OHD39974.1 MAG: lipopolysaccharide biosynthesis protein RfbH [Spirochaetes bacterium GWD1_27_9]
MGSLKYQSLKKIIKFSIKYNSKTYFNLVKKDSQNKYIPPSGKVITQKDLNTMIEASLNMNLTGGKFNIKFEQNLCKYFNLNFALAVNSGSSANLLAITALKSNLLGDKKLNDFDEVLTVATCFPTTVAPIIQNNLIPVFIDINKETYNIEVEQIENFINSKTKAIFIAHTLGNPFNLNKIKQICKKYNLWLIEDNCDSLGSMYDGKLTGSFGDISTLSFYPAHHITSGEGGAVLTNNPIVNKILHSLRDWGRDCTCKPAVDNSCGKRFSLQYGSLPKGFDHKYIYSDFGYNFKMTDWQAALGYSQLKRINFNTKKRKLNFNLIYESLKNFHKYLTLPHKEEQSNPSWFGFPITVIPNDFFTKNDLVNYLEKSGIGTRPIFAGNILRHPLFINNDVKLKIKNSNILLSSQLNEDNFKELPNTDFVMNNSFWIGLWHGLKFIQIEYIISQFSNFFDRI